MKPIMSKATAMWLIENTSLTFAQIADFCGLHLLEVEAMANDDVSVGIMGLDPVTANQLDSEEIKKGEEDPNYKLQLKMPPTVNLPKRRQSPRYTPIAKRQDRPTAILWLLKNHPELTDAQIGKLVGTTKPTINSIRNRTHWNITNIHPVDPVALGLCKQSSLDEALKKAEKRKKKLDKGPDPRLGMKIQPPSESFYGT